MRGLQHKKEAFWFYRLLSVVYDDFVVPFFWNARMRDDVLELAELDNPDLTVVDVGSGTGFMTSAIVRHVHPWHVTCLDQSPHQMRRARCKPELSECGFVLGDAENLPFSTDHFDRFISTGSIAHWPNPMRGVAEAYRILVPGGLAMVMGPLRPRGEIARTIADSWAHCPAEQDYTAMFEAAGFENIRTHRVRPSWVRNEDYAVAIAGRKPMPGPSPAANTVPGETVEAVEEPLTPERAAQFVKRLAIGSLAGAAFIPVAVGGHLSSLARYHFQLGANPPSERPDPMTPRQVAGLTAIATGVAWMIARRLGNGRRRAVS